MTRRFSSISVQTTLSVGVSNTALVMAVPVGTGSTLMGGVSLTAGNVDQYALNIDPNTASAEVVYVTGVSGDNLTVLRGQDGTSAIAHNAGAVIQHTLTGGDLAYFVTGVTPTANLTVGLPFPGSTSGTNTLKAPAIAGTTVTTLPVTTDTLVGRATTDTLTNKTLTLPIIDNPALGFATTVTAAGTTVLTVASAHAQEMTGTNIQNLTLPVAATMTAVGQGYRVPNNSTGVVTVNSSGGNLVYAIPANTEVTFTVKLLSGTTAASWDYKITGTATAASGAVTNFFSTTLLATATTISVPSIPGTSKNIRVVFHGKGPGASTATLLLRFNADTAANYDYERLYANATTATANETFGATSMMVGRIDATTASGSIIIPNYASTVLNKNAIGHFFAKWGTATTNITSGVFGGSWRNSAAITQLDFTTDSGDFQIGTHFDVYLEN